MKMMHLHNIISRMVIEDKLSLRKCPQTLSESLLQFFSSKKSNCTLSSPSSCTHLDFQMKNLV